MSDPVVASPNPGTAQRSCRGQSMVEFALVLPILLLLVGGIIQLGVVIATSHTLIQVARDTARFAATRNYTPCNAAAVATPPEPLTEANRIAVASNLMGYADGDWNTVNFVVHPNNTPLPATSPHVEGIEVVWTEDVPGNCPTTDNSDVSYITVRVSHRAPVLLPGLAYLPSLGTCDGSGCYLAITSKAQFRMEPPPPSP